jgi:hypothetical protein
VGGAALIRALSQAPPRTDVYAAGVSQVLRAVSASDAPFWAWWLAPAGVTAVVAVVAAVARRERGTDRHDTLDDDYLAFRRAMIRVRETGRRR